MASIVSTSRPYGLDNNSSSINTGSNISNNTPTGNVAVNGLSNTLSSSGSKIKTNYKTPGINNFNQSIKQQAIKADTINTDKPTVVHENRYLNKATTANNTNNLSNTDRNNLTILNNWGNKLRATNQANNVTTYMDDPSTVPLIRRDTMGFFSVTHNADGTYNWDSVGIQIPFTDIVIGKGNIATNMSWNPVQAYSVAYPVGNYLVNFDSYSTKNKIVQGTLALANSYSNYYNGTKNFVDDYAIKEWGNLVDMSINWKDRNAMENTVAGLNTVSQLSQRYGLNKYFGGDNIVGGVQDAIALYTFGNSVYQLGNNWSKMSTGERTMGVLNTMNSGLQAYGALKPYYLKYFGTTIGEQGTASVGETVANTAIKEGSKNVAASGVNSVASSGYQGGGSLAGNGAYQGGGSLAGKGAYVGAENNTTASLTESTAENAASEQAGSVYANNTWGAKATNGLNGAMAGWTVAQSRGKSDRTSAGWAAATAAGGAIGGPWGAAAVLAVQGVEQFCENGRSTASDRKNGAVAGAAAGAMVGSAAGPMGAAIGAIIGAVCGVVANSAKTGHSREQYHRGIYREALGQTGIFEKAAKGTEHHGHFYYQLADGQYYNVGIDGHSGRASDINGKIKTVYDQSQILDRDMHNSEKINHEIRPYDIDYTCNMDYTGSLMLAPLNALGLGGSNIEDTAEYNQMLGYMTNACTSNVGRDMTRDNFEKMISNIKAGYERVGINNREDAQNALGLSYMQGNITDEDWNSFQLGLNLLYNDNGYDQAMSLMDQLGRDTSQKSVEEIGAAQPTGEIIPDNSRPAANEPAQPTGETIPVAQEETLNPENIPAETSTAMPERATQEELWNETNPAKDAAREQFIQEQGTGE